MLDQSRRLLLTWWAVTLAAFAAMAVGVAVHPGPWGFLDTVGRTGHRWASGLSRLPSVLRFVEDAFDTPAMTAYTVIVALALMAKRYWRAAGFTVGVMLATSVVNALLKRLIDRPRPAWEDAPRLADLSFPSGHSSGIVAFAGVVSVLALMLLRRRSLRRVVYAAAGLLAVIVVADRVLLGRHYPTDTVGGALFGASVVILGLALYNPLPRSHADTAEPLPAVMPTGRNLAVVVNPVKVEDVMQFRTIVSSMARASGWAEPLWYYTTVEDPGTGMAHDAALGGADLVLVCGGDGTVREVCAELAGTGIPVGIVPAGTGNLLARNLDIPLFLRAAVDVALTGQDRAIDLVNVSGDGFEDTHFMVMAGMGFDAAIMEGVNEEVKKRVGWVAYVFSALKSLMFPAAGIEISVDGGEFTRHRVRTVVVGNVGYLQAGMPLLPDAAIDDGLLDVVLLHPKRFVSWIPLAVRVLAKRKRTDDLINRMTGQSVVIRAHTDTPRQLDGDSIGAGRELRMECVHGRLLVRVPR